MDNIQDLVEQMQQLLREAEMRGYDRGYNDGVSAAKSKILAAIDGGVMSTTSLFVENKEHTESARYPHTQREKPTQERLRAPRGLPRALIARVLKKSPNGSTPQQIVDAAETEFEKMIAVSSIRSELRRGQEDNRYLEVDGLWFLMENTEAEAPEYSAQRPFSKNDGVMG